MSVGWLEVVSIFVGPYATEDYDKADNDSACLSYSPVRRLSGRGRSCECWNSSST